ncbi:uncharacterized protein [Haliotis asinina]|uniref:uncharacterized protein n=1 Tax=Haliotis asinina TaxID=109174 RepID=UPI0035320D9F
MLLLACYVILVGIAAPSEGGAHCEIASLERLFRRIDSQMHNLEKATDFGCKPCHDPGCDKPCINSIVKEDLMADMADLKRSLRSIVKKSIPCEGSENVFITDCQNDTIWRLNPNEIPHVAAPASLPFSHLTAGLRTLPASDSIFDFVIDANSDSVTIDYLVSNPFQVFCTDLNGTNPRLVTDSSDMPSMNFEATGIAYFADNDELIMPVSFTDATPSTITAVTRTGSVLRTVASFTGLPSKIAVQDGVVYVVFDDEIRTVPASTTNGTLSTLYSHYCPILVFDVLPTGTLLFMDDYGELYSLDVGTLYESLIYGTRIPADPSDLRFNECDGLVYIVYGESDQVEVLETDGTLVKTLTLPFGPLQCPSIDFLPPMLMGVDG